MSESDVQLKIALEALLDLKRMPFADEDDAYRLHERSIKALHAIVREHYLGEPSPVVREVLAGVKGF